MLPVRPCVKAIVPLVSLVFVCFSPTSLFGSKPAQAAFSQHKRGKATAKEALLPEYTGPIEHVGNGVSSPELIRKTEPQYSKEASKAKLEGTALLAAVIDAQGTPRNIRVIRPLGLGLDERAVEAVSRWGFKPAMKGAQPVAVWANIEVSFRLLPNAPVQ